MNVRSGYISLIAACVLTACGIGIAAKPNIVVFLTDDQGYGDVG